MTIQELTDRMNEFVGEMGWYGPDSPFQHSPLNIAISLALVIIAFTVITISSTLLMASLGILASV